MPTPAHRPTTDPATAADATDGSHATAQEGCGSALAARAAAVAHDARADIDALLAGAARDAARRGRRVRGLVMQRPPAAGAAAECVGTMVLVDLHTGERFVVSQDLGPGARGCRVDPRGFVRAGRVLRDALEDASADGVDLVVVNRYGKLEAGGEGFADEMLALMAAGVPLLTAVAPQHRPAWHDFTGGAAIVEPRAEALAAWIDRACAPARR